MKTNIEQHIKSRLDERKLNPSEISWDKLSQMLDEEKPQTKTIRFPKWWTISIAASIVVCVSVFVVNSFEQTEEIPVQITDTKKVKSEISTEKNEIISEEIQPENIQTNEKSISNKTELVQSNSKPEVKIKSKQNSEIIQTQTVQEKIAETNLIQQELKLPEVKKQEEIAVNSEPEKKSKPEAKKKTNYTNPDMLLYSVENNQAISETNNDNSRLVIIDFNK
ncbi:hypothetical protein [Moheibacter sediminis]|uniref:Uncharacterized protein n=1 Tax=Moheibacter sediminis TaxID=1434700 RepID=A0A1W1YCD2_9FLAO|nr:hypothetical protein [Moheibacter sediminis]SMC33817.1 hypothetical protein SAMN06296427_101255 [Moheibacter sediminis]